MATAIFRTGGKQYRVAQGDVVRVEKLEGNRGDKVSFDDVLFVGGDDPKIGKPRVPGGKVEAEIVAQDRGEKLVIFKYKRRKRQRRRAGHRQYFTAVKITGIAG